MVFLNFVRGVRELKGGVECFLCITSERDLKGESGSGFIDFFEGP